MVTLVEISDVPVVTTDKILFAPQNRKKQKRISQWINTFIYPVYNIKKVTQNFQEQ